MNGKKLFFFLLLISLISLSFSVNNWTIGNNSITINTYNSNLTSEERDNYYYWIGLRNSFYYSEDSNQLEKLVKYFTPEENNYYRNLFNFSLPGLICAGAVVVIFLIYLVRRFLMKGCRGPKDVMKSYHIITYLYIIVGFLVGIIFLSLTIYNSGKSK